MALIRPCRGKWPVLGADVWVAENATIVGEVTIGAGSSLWFQCVVRGDVCRITLGDRVNIQDGAILHGTYKRSETHLEDEVSIGHGAIIHGCRVEHGALVGMGAVVMDHAVVGAQSLIAAGSVVLEGSKIESGYLYAGVPAKRIKKMDEALIKMAQETPQRYVRYASWFKEER